MNKTIVSIILAFFFFCISATFAEPQDNASYGLVPNQHYETAVSRQISTEVLSCKSSDPGKQILCRIVLSLVNSELRKAGIQINTNDVLFTFNDGKVEGIDTGRSCSVRAEIRHKHATASFKRPTKLDLMGNSLSDPLAIALEIPVDVSARIDARQTFGAKIFGKCRRIGRDSFAFKARLSTLADILVGFRLNPTLTKLSNGDFQLTVMPGAALVFELKNNDLRFRVSGVSPIARVFQAVTGTKFSLLDALLDLAKGRKIKDVIENLKKRLAFDLGSQIILGIGALPRPIENLIFRLIGDVIGGKRLIEKNSRGFSADIEDKLNERIRKALKTDRNGKRVFTIKKDFVNLVGKFGDAADIFIAPKPITKPPQRFPPRPRPPRGGSFSRPSRGPRGRPQARFPIEP